MRSPWLLALPLAVVLGVFLVVPLLVLIVVSFLDYDSVQILWVFVLENYREALTSAATWNIFGVTLGYAAATWAVTLVPSRCRTRPGAWGCSWSARCHS